MARDRDDDRDDRDDDRPRRRRDYDDPPPKKGGVGMVLLIVGLAVGIPVLICGGVIVYMVYVAQQFVASVTQMGEQFTGSMQATAEANTFIDMLETAPDSAYERTTADYKRETSKDQFKKTLKDNPVLTVQHYHTKGQFPTPTGTSPNRKVSLTTTVIAGVDPNPNSDVTYGTSKKPTAPKPTQPMMPSTAPKPRDVTVTITLAEQPDKTWKVDGFIVN